MLPNDAAYTTLNTDITVTNAAEFATAVANSDDQTIANAYNLVASPDYWVWRTAISAQEVYAVTTGDGTSWSWTAFINRSQGERDGWREMFAATGVVNAALANIRQGIADIFSGTTGAAQRAHLLAIGRRQARRIEKLFSIATVGGVGTRGSTANPDTMTFEGTLTARDVAHALRGVALSLRGVAPE